MKTTGKYKKKLGFFVCIQRVRVNQTLIRKLFGQTITVIVAVIFMMTLDNYFRGASVSSVCYVLLCCVKSTNLAVLFSLAKCLYKLNLNLISCY